MKNLLIISLTAIVGSALLTVAGCSQSGGGNIDTSKVQSAFQTAPPVDKAEVQNAISEVKAKNYSGAVASLQRVASSANLTPEQKSAVKDLMTQVQTKGLNIGHEAMGAGRDMTNKAGQAVEKSAQDLTNQYKP